MSFSRGFAFSTIIAFLCGFPQRYRFHSAAQGTNSSFLPHFLLLRLQIQLWLVALETTTVRHDCGSWAVTGAVKLGRNAVSGMVWVCREEGAFGKVVSAGCLASALQMQFGV